MDKLVELLEKNGLMRVEARALALFSDGQDRTSLQIEYEAGLRQPEVSVAMPRMVGRGWFTVTPKKAPGKGRPYFIYRLALPYKEICQEVATIRGQELAEMMADLNALRAVA